VKGQNVKDRDRDESDVATTSINQIARRSTRPSMMGRAAISGIPGLSLLTLGIFVAHLHFVLELRVAHRRDSFAIHRVAAFFPISFTRRFSCLSERIRVMTAP
jgi:hypothetical protein